MVDSNPLVPLVRKYIAADAEAVARTLESMPEEDIIPALRELPPVEAAQAFPYLQDGYAAALLANAPPELFEAVVGELAPERAAQIFTRLPADAKERFVPRLPPRTAPACRSS